MALSVLACAGTLVTGAAAAPPKAVPHPPSVAKALVAVGGSVSSGGQSTVQVRVAYRPHRIRVRVGWDDRLAGRPGRNAFRVRVVTVTQTHRPRVIAAFSRNGKRPPERVFTVRLTAADRAAVRRADRTIVAVTQQHDRPDGDRAYERGYATVTTLGTSADPGTATDVADLRDCSTVPIRPRADLRDCDLFGVDLHGADLSGADLSGATLSLADLTGADLSDTTLVNASLFSAYLTRANLVRANLVRAVLDGAYLSWANLTGANLTGGSVSVWSMDGATLSGAVWVNGRTCATPSIGRCA